MQQELLIAIIAGLGGMLGWGLADFFAKKTVDKIGDITTLVWAHLFGTLAFALIALFQQVNLKREFFVPTQVSEWGGLIFFGVLQAVVYLFVYKGFGKGQLAILNPVFASYSGIAALLSIIIFGETLIGFLPLALVAIFGGILLLNIDIEALHNKRFNITHAPGLKEVGIAAILAAFWTISWDQFIGGKDWMSYALFMYVFMTIAAIAIAKFQRVNLFVVKKGLWKFLILIGLCEVVAYISISLGFSTTSYTSIVAILSGAFSLPTLILAHFFLKEKVTLAQRIGSVIIILGIIIIAMR